MNQSFYEFAKAKLENMTTEELYESLRAAGIDATIRQFPEPEEKPEQD